MMERGDISSVNRQLLLTTILPICLTNIVLTICFLNYQTDFMLNIT